MEVVEVCTQQKYCPPPAYQTNPPLYPKNQTQKCKIKYVQPPRVASFAPKRLYQSPSTRFHALTTYHEAFLTTDTAHSTRPKAVKLSANIHISNAKFEDGTTHKLAYQPVWEIVKAKPIIPSHRKLNSGPMESTTTNRIDFIPKNVDKPEIIIPPGNIRTCHAPFEGITTSGRSYAYPGYYRPPDSFKPRIKYIPPEVPIAHETTHKFNYPPLAITVKEKYPWAEKDTYKRPEVAMDGNTTYTKTFIVTEQPVKERPIIPPNSIDWLKGSRKFIGVSCYREEFVPRQREHVIIKIPDENIRLSDKKMTDETTTKMSYRPVVAEKRHPIKPTHQMQMIGKGSVESTTTNRIDYQPKIADKSVIVIPPNNICSSNKPFDGVTTTARSFVNYGIVMRPSSIKPSGLIPRSTGKFDDYTVNKMSYKPWTLNPPEDYPWARKAQYQRPEKPMIGETTYQSTFVPPGHFIEECENECHS